VAGHASWSQALADQFSLDLNPSRGRERHRRRETIRPFGSAYVLLPLSRREACALANGLVTDKYYQRSITVQYTVAAEQDLPVREPLEFVRVTLKWAFFQAYLGTLQFEYSKSVRLILACYFSR
jgi:hypothetical protein